MRRWALAAGGLVTVAALYLAWTWYSSRDLLLSQRPPERASVAEIPETDSDISFRLQLRYDVLQQAVNQKVPRDYEQHGKGGEPCVFIPFAGPACIGPYSFTVRREGDIAISRASDLIRAAAGISLTGRAELQGDGAKLLGPDSKGFSAGANVRADVGLAIAQDWCPKIELQVRYDWTQAPRVDFGRGLSFDVSPFVSRALDQSLKNLGSRASDFIRCDIVRAEVLKAWRRNSIRLDVPNAPPIYLNIRPTSIGLSKLIADESAAKFILSMKAKTSVSTSEDKQAPPQELPPVSSLADQPGKFRITLPIGAEYRVIETSVMQELGRKPILFDVGPAQGSLTVDGIEVFPSGDSIALGLSFRAKLPASLFDTAGKVYVTGTPIVDADGTRLRLAHIEFARMTSNPVWSVASAVFGDTIRQQIEKAAIVDLRQPIATALSEVQRAIADPARTGGIRLTLTEPRLRLERVIPEAGRLTVLGTAEGYVEGELVDLKVD